MKSDEMGQTHMGDVAGKGDPRTPTRIPPIKRGLRHQHPAAPPGRKSPTLHGSLHSAYKEDGIQLGYQIPLRDLGSTMGRRTPPKQRDTRQQIPPCKRHHRGSKNMHGKPFPQKHAAGDVCEDQQSIQHPLQQHRQLPTKKNPGGTQGAKII